MPGQMAIVQAEQVERRELRPVRQTPSRRYGEERWRHARKAAPKRHGDRLTLVLPTLAEGATVLGSNPLKRQDADHAQSERRVEEPSRLALHSTQRGVGSGGREEDRRHEDGS